MDTWVDRVIILPDGPAVALARQLAAAVAGPSGQGMWTTPLSPTGLLPATHWISSGKLWEQFAAMLQDVDALVAATAGKVPRAALEHLVAVGIVRDSDQPFAVLEELGLRIASEPEPAPEPDAGETA